jgi:cob(I)alamin adenosyltransferase
MKLYTKRGDAGDTDLFGGQRVSKASLRVDAYGSVDELNSVIGLAASGCTDAEVLAMLQAIQSRLFEIGADLATPRHAEQDAAPSAIPRVGDEQIGELEDWIDTMSAGVPAMRSFILPGGTELAARLHVARTVCRRAERLCVALHQHEPIGAAVIIYLNRLSDLLFAAARHANHAAGIDDIPWVSPRQKK